jgi:urease accessory protein
MNPSLYRLLHLSDPALPVGGFAHSAGLETYVQMGIVHDEKTANAFITGMLSQNLHYTDAAIASLAYDAAALHNMEKIIHLDDLCSAVKLPKEMRQASQKLGNRLTRIFQSLCNHEQIHQYAAAVRSKQAGGHYCLAFGVIAYALGISKQDALNGFYYSAASGFVTNSVKLIPLSQQSGQEILFSLHELINDLVQANMSPDIDLIGVYCTGFDIRCMQHERLYSRLYMS